VSAPVPAQWQAPLPHGGQSAQAGLQAAWELDIFGAQRDAVQAGQARLVAAQMGWHEARVSVAAEAVGGKCPRTTLHAPRTQSEKNEAAR
jgi:outer membrane protein TolC